MRSSEKKVISKQNKKLVTYLSPYVNNLKKKNTSVFPLFEPTLRQNYKVRLLHINIDTLLHPHFTQTTKSVEVICLQLK